MTLSPQQCVTVVVYKDSVSVLASAPALSLSAQVCLGHMTANHSLWNWICRTAAIILSEREKVNDWRREKTAACHSHSPLKLLSLFSATMSSLAILWLDINIIQGPSSDWCRDGFMLCRQIAAESRDEEIFCKSLKPLKHSVFQCAILTVFHSFSNSCLSHYMDIPVYISNIM